MGRLGISVVIPSWNGLHLLRENLPSVLAAARAYRHETGEATEIIVVDDGSEDETCSALPAEFPEILLIPKPRNEGFAAACNEGFRHCRFPLVALLNNDVRIQEDYLKHHAAHFADPAVFAVTAKVFEWDAPVFAAGGRYGRFRRGFWSVYFNYDVSGIEAAEWIQNRRLLSAYAIGGFSTFDRAKLEQLDGFNEMLSPFHWEDVDLSYRGWKRGWEVHYEPRSIAFHRASATIDAHFEKKSVEAVSFRNRLLFHWMNIHSTWFLLRHLFMLALLFLTRIFVLDFDFYRSFFQALRYLEPVRAIRRRERWETKRSDPGIQRLLKSFYRSAPIQVYYNQREVLRKHPDAG